VDPPLNKVGAGVVPPLDENGAGVEPPSHGVGAGVASPVDEVGTSVAPPLVGVGGGAWLGPSAFSKIHRLALLPRAIVQNSAFIISSS
jgi:hypothetical protein